MTPCNGDKVTVSDCGKALDEIAREIDALKLQTKEIDRRIQALRTQALIINALVRRIA